MRAEPVVGLLVSCLLLLFFVSPAAKAAEYPKDPVTIKLEAAKLPPVVFPHETHEKQKIDCVKCHHKDPQDPKACTTCHGKEAKDSRPAARDAFHTRCQGCHKEMATEGLRPPTRCMECHKK